MSMNKLIDYFDKIYVINLESRADRRKEIDVELEKINLSLDDPKVILFKAIKPLDAGEFPSIGAKGCFLSHLGVLKDVKVNKYQRILIFEDDLNLNNDFTHQSNLVLNDLLDTQWDIFYGDYRVADNNLANLKNLEKIDFDLGVVTCNFMGINGEIVDELIDYFEAMLTRRGGDILGGPMHIDGAYNWFRKDNPNCITVLATPSLGYQRSSRSDIADQNWKNKIPFKSFISNFLNKIRNL